MRLLAGGSDNEVIGQCAARLSVQHTENVIGLRKVEIDAGIESIQRGVARRTEGQCILPNSRGCCRRGPYRKQLLRDWTDLGNFVKRNRSRSARIVDLLARGRAVAGRIEPRRTQGREIAAAEGRIRHGVGSCCSVPMKANALVVGEEEQLVFADGTADAPAELIVGEWVLRLGGIFKDISGIERLVALVLVCGALEGVRATLADRD